MDLSDHNIILCKEAIDELFEDRNRISSTLTSTMQAHTNLYKDFLDTIDDGVHLYGEHNELKREYDELRSMYIATDRSRNMYKLLCMLIVAIICINHCV